MAKLIAPRKVRTSEVARLPLSLKDETEHKNSFLSKDEMLDALRKNGFHPSVELVGQLKIPRYVYQGKYEKLEFYDVGSSPQPFPFHTFDSPSSSIKSGKEAPSWLKHWYLSITEEAGEKYMVLFFRPKNIFIRCALKDAEVIVPAAMSERAARV